MNGDSIAIAGIVFVAYAFIMITLAYMLADPLDMIVSAIGGADVPDANDALTTFIPMYRAAIKMALLLGMATPFVVFIMWVYNREPIQGFG
jgi:hypothetical protein